MIINANKKHGGIKMNDCEMYARSALYRFIVNYVLLNASFPTREEVLNFRDMYSVEDMVLFDNIYTALYKSYKVFEDSDGMKTLEMTIKKSCFGDERVEKLIRRIIYHMSLTSSTGSCVAYSLMAYCGLKKLGYDPVFCVGSVFRFNGSQSVFAMGLHCWIELNHCVLDIAIFGNSAKSGDEQYFVGPKYFCEYAHTDVVYMPGVVLHGKKYFNIGDWEEFSTGPISGAESKELWSRYGIILAESSNDDVYSAYSDYFHKAYTLSEFAEETMGYPVEYVEIEQLNEVEFFKLFLNIEKKRSISEYVDKKGYEMELMTGILYENSALIKEGVEHVK